MGDNLRFLNFSKSAKYICFTLPLVSEVKGPFMYLFSFVLMYIICAILSFFALIALITFIFIGPYSLLLLVTDALRHIFLNIQICALHTHITLYSTHTLLHSSWHITSTLLSSGVRMSWREW